ncbi:MAG: DUF1592 domain-containing protein [Planctomycetes bacterium]|nr:DUF1592 domain-containing protein [Planctomycetota bacterium]
MKQSSRTLLSECLARLVVAVLVLCAPLAAQAAGKTGEQIYLAQCAKCHGDKGQGVKDQYGKPLAGDRSLAELAAQIAKTMPEDDPGTCVGEDAKLVAEYIYHAFYSPVAQVRNAPVRIELARLTVRQYRNTVADLIGSFRWTGRWDDKHGLQGEYSRTREFWKKEVRAFERLDPVVQFNFGELSPAAEPPKSDAPPAPAKQPEPKKSDKASATRSPFRTVADEKKIADDKKPDAKPVNEVKRKEEARQKAEADKQAEAKRKADEAKKKAEAERKAAEDKEKAEKAKHAEFGIHWQGGVYAPETGDYEFIVDTENAAELYVNNDRAALVDARVKSGKDTLHKQTIRLLGGRVYPLRLVFSKSKQAQDKTASITLKWKMPNRAEEVIPARYLTPHRQPQLFVLETAFPPDDRSMGYERGTSVSEAWSQAATDAALEVAAFVDANLDELSQSKPGAGDRAQKLRAFCQRWVERAFRRPLSDEQKSFFIDKQFVEGRPPELSVKRAVLLSLMAPEFLYLDLNPTELDQWDVASRLSYALWDSLPDNQLAEAANKKWLTTAESVRKQAERMLGDIRARSKLREFFLQWLNVDRFIDIAKDSKRFPEFDAEVVSDLRTSLELFLDDVAWSRESDFRQLLLADSLYINGALAKMYDVKLPAGADFEKVNQSGAQRAGVLTHPYLMAGFAYTSTSSPIHRGVFVARSVLGRSLRPPPEAVAPLAPELHADLTTRQRVILQTKAESCQSCHRMINPLGFAFENYDAIGRFRKVEQGKPVDATGAYQTRGGDMVKFNNVRDLAKYLAASDETHEAFVEQLFHFMIKQPINAFGPTELSKLEKSFHDQKFNIRKLLIEIAAEASLPPPAEKIAKSEK